MKTVILAAVVDKKRPMPNPEFIIFKSQSDYVYYIENHLDENLVMVNVQTVKVYGTETDK